MAPRRRPRQQRLTRMDAAVDAMTPFGFSEQLVTNTIKNLLEEYGGGDGWAFIEADAYSVLLESILNEQENGRGDSAQKGSLIPVDSLQDAGPSDGAVKLALPEVFGYLSQADKTGWKDFGLVQHSGQKEMLHSAGNLISMGINEDNIPIQCLPAIPSPPSPPLVGSLPTQRRKPCYGWIGDTDDDDDFIQLTPAVVVVPKPAAISRRQSERSVTPTKKPVKRNRWDYRPENM